MDSDDQRLGTLLDEKSQLGDLSIFVATRWLDIAQPFFGVAHRDSPHQVKGNTTLIIFGI